MNNFFAKHIVRAAALALPAALILTLIASPGIFYSDTYARIELIDELLNRPQGEITSTRFALMPVLLMMSSKILTNGYFLYTFFCALAYFTISFYALEKFPGSGRLKYLLFFVNPVLWGAAVWSAPGVLCAAMILLLITVLSKEFNTYDYFLFFLCSVFIFGCRENALIILPLVFVYIFAKKITKIQKLCCFLAVLFGLSVPFILTSALNIKKEPIYSAGFAWEVLSVIDELPDNKKFDRTNNITTDKTVILHTVDIMKKDKKTVNSFLWEQNNPFSIYLLKNNDILHSYFDIVKDNPAVYAKVKTKFILKALGIYFPLGVYEYDYNRWDGMNNIGFHDTKERKLLCFLFNNGAKINLICFPFAMFVLSFWLLCFAKRKKLKNYDFCLKLFLFAILYYSAFFITALSFEIRYFFPSYYLLCVSNICIVSEMFKRQIFTTDNPKEFSSLI